MSKLTDKIDALIDFHSGGLPGTVADLRSILADVRELEESERGARAMWEDDKRFAKQRGLDEEGQAVAIRTAKREAYEHALRILENSGEGPSFARRLQDNIDALDTEEGT